MNHSNKIDSIIDSITKEMVMEAAKKYLIKPETIIFHPNKDTVSSN